MLDPNGNPAPTRPDGWYWVRKLDGFSSNSGEWVCAYWSQRFALWSSAQFIGVTDAGLAEIGDRIPQPFSATTKGTTHDSARN